MSTTPVPPPTKQTNWVVWVLGIAGAAVILFILGGLLIAGYFLKGVRINQAAQEVRVSTPAGELTVSRERGAEVGLPVYPGATLVEPGASVEFTPGEEVDTEKVGLIAAKYRTPDAMEKVDAWYRERLGPDFQREGPGGKRVHVHLRGISIHSDDIAYVHEKDDLVHVVALKREGSGVEIALLRMGAQQAQ